MMMMIQDPQVLGDNAERTSGWSVDIYGTIDKEDVGGLYLHRKIKTFKKFQNKAPDSSTSTEMKIIEVTGELLDTGHSIKLRETYRSMVQDLSNTLRRCDGKWKAHGAAPTDILTHKLYKCFLGDMGNTVGRNCMLHLLNHMCQTTGTEDYEAYFSGYDKKDNPYAQKVTFHLMEVEEHYSDDTGSSEEEYLTADRESICILNPDIMLVRNFTDEMRLIVSLKKGSSLSPDYSQLLCEMLAHCKVQPEIFGMEMCSNMCTFFHIRKDTKSVRIIKCDEIHFFTADEHDKLNVERFLDMICCLGKCLPCNSF